MPFPKEIIHARFPVFGVLISAGLLVAIYPASAQAAGTNETLGSIKEIIASTRRVDWIKFKGAVSLTELNAKCDLLVIGSLVKLPQITNNLLVTEIRFDSVLAAKGDEGGGFLIVGGGRHPPAGYLCKDLGKPVGVKDANPTLLPGGQFLLWLNKIEMPVTINTSDSNSPRTGHQRENEVPMACYTMTCGARGSYLISDIRSVQGNMIAPFVFDPYPWQQQFLDALIKTNDIAKLKRVVMNVARALKNDKTSMSLLQRIAKSSADPVLGGIAQEHLDKGITNIFNYVNPEPIP